MIKAGDKVRIRCMPGLGTGVVVQLTTIDAHNGKPFKANVELTGSDEGRAYAYVDSFRVADLTVVS